MTKRLLAAGLHIRAMTDSRPMPIKLDVTRFEDISVPAEVRTDTDPSSTMPVFMLASPMNQNHLSLFRTVAGRRLDPPIDDRRLSSLRPMRQSPLWREPTPRASCRDF